MSYRFIELPDLVARLGNIRASYRALLKQLDRLKNRICEDTEVKGIYLDEEQLPAMCSAPLPKRRRTSSKATVDSVADAVVSGMFV